MAKATTTRRDVTVTLEMSEDEAAAVAATLGRVLGSHEDSLRKHTSNTYWALAYAVDSSVLDQAENLLEVGSLHFADGGVE